LAEVEFELTFVAGAANDRHYTVEASSEIGRATADLVLLDEQALEERLAMVEEAVSMSSATTIMRSRPTVIERPVRRFGEELFNQVFRDEVGAQFRQLRERSRVRGHDLHVVIHAGTPALARIPWELMWDPVRRDYLALRCSVLRRSDATTTVDPPEVDGPLRLLVVAANPVDYPSLDIEGEQVRLMEALGPLVDSGRVEVTWLEGDRWDDLRRELRGDTQWDVLHFIGHGGFDPGRQEGFLALVGSDTKAAPLLATDLARLLETQVRLRLVVLNACHSARPASDDQYASTAATLVRDGVPGVVAMQYAVSDEAASVFAMTLYKELAEGLPLARAVTGGRLAITRHSAETLEWATPVVYLRNVTVGAIALDEDDDVSADHRVEAVEVALAEGRFEDVIGLVSPLAGDAVRADRVRLLLAAAEGLIAAGNLVLAREALQLVIGSEPDNATAASLLTGVRDRLAIARESASRELLDEKLQAAEQLVRRIENALRARDWPTVAYLVGPERAGLGVSPEHLEPFLRKQLQLSLAGLIGRTRRGMLRNSSPAVDEIATFDVSAAALALSFFDNNGTLTAYFGDGDLVTYWVTARTVLQTCWVDPGANIPGGQCLAVDGTGAWVSVLDGYGGVEVRDRLRGRRSIGITASGPVTAIAPAMTGLLAGAVGEMMVIWDVTSGAVVYAGYRHPRAITAISVVGEHAELAITACADGVLRVWSIPDDEVLASYDVRGSSSTLATDRYGTFAAYITPAMVELMPIPDRGGYRPSIIMSATAIDLDAEGTLLLVGCRDHTVRLFGTDDRGELAVIHGEVAPTAVRFGDSGTFAVAWGEKTIKIYDVGGQI